MHHFHINLSSFQQVVDFVSLATAQPFEVLVGNEKQQINAKNFMGMFSLDYNRPVRVSVTCSEKEFSRFRRDASRFVL